MIRFEDVKIDKHVPFPPKTEAKPKENKAPRQTLADKLGELKVGESVFLPEKKKASLSSQIVTARSNKKVSGKFQLVEYGIGGDSVFHEMAGTRIWRTEESTVTQMAAE